MIAAVVGLIGVALGALLGGVVNVWVEARRRRKLAYAAGLVIAAELDVIRVRMESGKSKGGAEWWSGDLPLQAWQAHMSELAACGVPASEGDEDAEPDLLTSLSKTYASIDRWNVNRTSQPAPIVADLDRDIELFGRVRSRLLAYVNRLSGPLRVATQRRVTVGAIVVALLLVIWLLLIPRPDVTATTVASALQTRLGSSQLVACENSNDHWFCIDYHLTEPRSACLATAAGLLSEPAASHVSISLTSQVAPCGESAPPTPYVAVQDGAELIYTPAQREQEAIAQALRPVPAKEENGFTRIINFFKGRGAS